jgi:phage shock protein A
MSLWNKIFTLFRGAATEAGQAVVDGNAIRILDQEIRDASAALVRSREDLTKLMAQRRLVGDKLQPKQAKIAEYSSYIEQLLTRGDEALATEVAQKLAALETETADDSKLATQYDANIATLKQSILKAESTISRLRQQVDSVKATENVQRAQASMAARSAGNNSALRTAADSLERIKARQAETTARIDAAQEVDALNTDTDLNAKLAKAGLIEDSSSGAAVLARFKAKSNAALPPPSQTQALPPPVIVPDGDKVG